MSFIVVAYLNEPQQRDTMIDMTTAPLSKSEISAFANQKLAQYGLDVQGWTFEFNNRKRALGLCNYTKKTIYISKHFAETVAGDKIKDTVLHEIAHALAGAGNGHNYVWKAWCMKIGANPKATCSLPDTQKIKGKYALMLGDEVICHYHRMPKLAKDLSKVWLRGRKAETKGKLKLVAIS